MQRNEMVYVSEYNLELLRKDVKNVSIFDTTLRDGEQAPGMTLSIDDKIKIACALDELGVDVMEVGFAASGDPEKKAIKKIANKGCTARVCSLARCKRNDVDVALDCDVDYLHTFIATSDIHLKYKLKLTKEDVKAKAIDTVEYARSHGLTVQFSCEDATRTDLDFLKEMYIAVQDAGANIINVPDTVGVIAVPAMTYLITELKKIAKVPIAVHCHNDLGLAVANSMAAVEAGAEQIHVCVNGLGERTGNTALEEIAVGLFANYGIETVDLSKIGSVSKLVSRSTGYPIPHNKPIVGRNAFTHESGIHVHGMLNSEFTYEAFKPKLVGMNTNLVLGKHSGAHSVKDRINELKIRFPDEKIPELLARIKELAIGGKEIDDAELIGIVDHMKWKEGKEEIVKLKKFSVFTGKGMTPTATVTIDIEGKLMTRSDTGIGPVDATMNAIRSAVGESITLEDYRLNAVTGGSDSICEVTVVIKGDQGISVGKAVGLDIVEVSADAAVEAINGNYLKARETVNQQTMNDRHRSD